jgi:integrase
MPRLSKVNKETYFEAIKKTKDIEDRRIGDYLGVNRSTVYRFRNNPENREIYENALQMIESYDNLTMDKQVSKKVFYQMPDIQNGIKLLKSRNITNEKIKARVNLIYNLCKHLKTHPQKLSVDRVSDFITEQKIKYYNNEPQIKGLYYTTTRDAVRSYFMINRGISGEYLTSKGIDQKETKGAGQNAHIRITPEQRKQFEKTLFQVIKKSRDNYIKNNLINSYLEILMIVKFMFYTGTRKTATYNAKFSDVENTFTNEFYSIKIIDKGKNGGIKWFKLLTNYSLEEFQKYIEKRFKISKDEQINKLNKLENIFPIVTKINSRLITSIIKKGLKEIGIITDIPNHIWRHCYVQEFLKATNYNYELCASIGGWKSTKTLKKHYGEIDEVSKLNGLKKAMGIKTIEKEIVILKW